MAQAVTPRSFIIANSACRSGASGVVSAVLISSASTRVPTVPITAARTPARWRALSARRVVVVLPWVPVTPSIRSDRAGSPYTCAAKRPSRDLGAATSSTGSPLGARAAPALSVSTATAPASTADAT